ncbi:MAG: biotin--[acetyl-CoA-carboxylase] ligase [Saprospiraceae bacterium]
MRLATLFIGHPLHYEEVLDSSHLHLLEKQALHPLSEGMVVQAGYQTAGRGQAGRYWWASPGMNLLLSVVLYPRWVEAQHAFALSQAVSLAVADVVTTLSGKQAWVKWPNDVYVNNRKIAGILIHNHLRGSQLEWSVASIGLNVNEDDFPDDLTNKAISLRQLTSTDHSIEAVTNQLLLTLEQRYLQLKADTRQVAREWLQRLYQYQEWHDYQRLPSGETFHGMIVGVRPNGQLAVQHTDNTVSYFNFKTISFQPGYDA